MLSASKLVLNPIYNYLHKFLYLDPYFYFEDGAIFDEVVNEQAISHLLLNLLILMNNHCLKIFMLLSTLCFLFLSLIFYHNHAIFSNLLFYSFSLVPLACSNSFIHSSSNPFYLKIFTTFSFQLPFIFSSPISSP